MKADRLIALDYLRGITALGMMSYHYSSWFYVGSWDAHSFFGRLGIYGVSVFFILSGFTLFYSYHKRLNPDFESLRSFTLARLFRIFPLLWVVQFCTILLLPRQNEISWQTILLNISGLFAFFAWTQPIGIGVWSIGNELVYYELFPVLLFISRAARTGYAFAALGCIGLTSLVYGSFAIDSAKTLVSQWSNYINPINNLVFFILGIVAARILSSIQVKSKISYGFICISIILFTMIPAHGDPVTLVTGWRRLVFILICTSLVIGVRFLADIPQRAHAILFWLGEKSYAIYLLHPLTYKIIFFHSPFKNAGLTIKVATSVVLTLTTAQMSYSILERPCILIGKRIIRRASG